MRGGTVAGRIPSPRPERQLAGRAEAEDAGDVLGAGAEAAFLAAAVDQRLQRHPAGRPARRRPWGRKLLGRERTRSAGSRARSIGTFPAVWQASVWKRIPAPSGDRRDLLDRLEDAGLVVGVHDRDQPGGRAERAPHVVGVDPPSAADRQVGDPVAQRLQEPARGEHRRVLDPRGDDVDRRPRPGREPGPRAGTRPG